MRTIALLTLLFTTACDGPETADLAAEVDRLETEVAQLEADLAAAHGRLRLADPLDMPAAPDRAVSFREEGPPWMIVVPKVMTIKEALSIVTSCPSAPVTLSASGRLPDITKTEQHVLGWGLSYMGTTPMKNCNQGAMYKAGGVDY